MEAGAENHALHPGTGWSRVSVSASRSQLYIARGRLAQCPCDGCSFQVDRVGTGLTVVSGSRGSGSLVVSGKHGSPDRTRELQLAVVLSSATAPCRRLPYPSVLPPRISALKAAPPPGSGLAQEPYSRSPSPPRTRPSAGSASRAVSGHTARILFRIAAPKAAPPPGYGLPLERPSLKTGASSPHHIERSPGKPLLVERPKLKLAFLHPRNLPIFTGSKIEDVNGNPLEIILVEVDTGLPAALDDGDPAIAERDRSGLLVRAVPHDEHHREAVLREVRGAAGHLFLPGPPRSTYAAASACGSRYLRSAHAVGAPTQKRVRLLYVADGDMGMEASSSRVRMLRWRLKLSIPGIMRYPGVEKFEKG